MTVRTRPLDMADLDRVVAIDRATTGRNRRHFFEKRLATAGTRPSDFIQIGVTEADTLRGFALAHMLRGEFGQRHAVAVLESIGVAPDSRARGLGQALMQSVIVTARERGAKCVHSEVDWGNSDLLRFFNAARFELNARLALERPAGSLAEPAEQEP